MNHTLILLGLVLGGMLNVVSLVFAIISLRNNRKNNAIGWSAGFLASLAIVIFSVLQLAGRLGEDVVEEHTNNNNSGYNDEGRKAERQEWLDSLQLHNIEKYEDRIPADYYTNRPAVKNSDGIIRIPFLYPFEFLYNGVSRTGDIVIEGEDSVFVENVSELAFDENFAIIRADNSQAPELLKDGHPATEYMLFDLRTRNFENAQNMEMLLDLGRRIGYTGPQQLRSLSDACRGWIAPND